MSDQMAVKLDLDELIFASKNKEYGAYKLRKEYNFHLSAWNVDRHNFPRISYNRTYNL